MSSDSAPDAAVVLVDIDDRPVAPETFEAIEGAHGLDAELILIDARTTPGRAWAGSDSATILRAESGRASGYYRALALERVPAPFIAFVDARIRLGERSLHVALDRLRSQEDLGAVTAYVDGVPTLNFTGNVGPRHAVLPNRPSTVLYPNPEFAVFRTSAVHAVGGFDDDVTWAGAAVRAGWASSVMGASTLLLPDVVAETTCSCEPDPLAALFALHGCLGSGALAAALPAALHVAAARDAMAGAPGPSTVDRFVAALPQLEGRRREIQGRRSVEDSDLLELLVTALEPGAGDEHLGAQYSDVVDRYGLREIFPARHRILIVTPDILAERMAGPAIRAWQIADALADRHTVTLASTASTCEVSSPRFAVTAPGDTSLRRLAKEVEVVVVQGFAMEGRPYLRAEEKIVLVDLYDPLHLEQLELFKDGNDELRRFTIRQSTRVLNEQLVRGDFFVCASAKQRDFWLGQLAGLGRVNFRTYDADQKLEDLLAVVPFGIPDIDPVSSGPAIKGVVPGVEPGDDVLLWGGGIYNWFDPLTLIRAVFAMKDDLPRLRLFFMGLRHPNPDVQEMRMASEARRLAKALGLTGRQVFFNEGWVPYADRQNYLLEAAVGVSTHFDHLETEFSFRTRVLDYIWAGLPIVATDGDSFAPLIRDRGLGLVVPPGDVEALADALRLLLTDADLAATCRRNVEALRPDFRWSRVLGPIVDFCSAPHRAPDLSDLDTRATVWSTDEDRLQDFLRHQPTLTQRLRRIASPI